MTIEVGAVTTGRETRSVLQDWVMRLPLREQGTLLTGFRGCDLAPKQPHTLDSTERRLVAFLRYCFAVPADAREVDYEPGCFYISSPPENWSASELGHYPLHWVAHLIHCYEIIAYRHPDQDIAMQAWNIYDKIVHSLHLEPEDRLVMTKRLSEDRIEKGNVVA